MNTKIIALANQKGGVGKTTCCVNLSAALATLKKKILLIDLDPQGNATMGCGVNKSTVKFTSGDVLQGKAAIDDAILDMGYFDLLPSNIDVTEAEVNVLDQPNKHLKLTLAIQKIADTYEWIFIDCPPSLNILTLNALIAANSIIIPMQCEYYALEGLSSLINTIDDINCNFQDKNLYIEGIVRTMYDARNKLSKDVSAQLTEHFNELVYKTVIPRNVRLAEAPSYGLPVIIYDKSSAGAKAYLNLAQELLNNNPHRTSTIHAKKLQRETNSTEKTRGH
jgi:chromosome partitioning protein